MNFFKKIKNIHFVGIGGAGMIGIARVLLQKGYKISGSDLTDSSELKKLRKNGAKVFIGHKKNQINDVGHISLECNLTTEMIPKTSKCNTHKFIKCNVNGLIASFYSNLLT